MTVSFHLMRNGILSTLIQRNGQSLFESLRARLLRCGVSRYRHQLFGCKTDNDECSRWNYYKTLMYTAQKTSSRNKILSRQWVSFAPYMGCPVIYNLLVLFLKRTWFSCQKSVEEVSLSSLCNKTLIYVHWKKKNQKY